MNEDKNSKFLFSTPVKPKKIQIFKRKKEEEQGDVYEQLSKILEDGSSGDVQEESLIYSREIERDEFLHEENEYTQKNEHKQDEENLPNISYLKRLKTLSSPQKYKDLSTPESKLSNFQTGSSKNRPRSPKRPIGSNLKSNRLINHKVEDGNFRSNDDFKNQQNNTNKASPFLIDPPDSSSIDQPESPKNHLKSPKNHLKSPKNQINFQKVDQTDSFPTNQINSHEINSHNLNQQSQNLSLPYAITNLESFSTVSICSLLVDKISKESSLINKLENDLNLLKNSIKEKEEMHENSIKFVGELKQTNCDLMHKNDSLKIELEKTNEMFSKYKDDMTKIISSLSDNVNVCILENTRLSKDNYSMRSNIYLLENVFKEENVTYQVKEELDNYVEEISRLFTLKQNLKIKKIFNTATGILRIALGIVGEEIELVEVSKKEIENFKEESELNFKEKENKITNYYLGVINGMNENLEECCFKILEEQSKVESVYFTFRNEIKRLKKKIKKMKKKRVKKTSSDSDIWDVFK